MHRGMHTALFATILHGRGDGTALALHARATALAARAPLRPRAQHAVYRARVNRARAQLRKQRAHVAAVRRVRHNAAAAALRATAARARALGPRAPGRRVAVDGTGPVRARLHGRERVTGLAAELHGRGDGTALALHARATALAARAPLRPRAQRAVNCARVNAAGTNVAEKWACIAAMQAVHHHTAVPVLHASTACLCARCPRGPRRNLAVHRAWPIATLL